MCQELNRTNLIPAFTERSVGQERKTQRHGVTGKGDEVGEIGRPFGKPAAGAPVVVERGGQHHPLVMS